MSFTTKTFNQNNDRQTKETDRQTEGQKKTNRQPKVKSKISKRYLS